MTRQPGSRSEAELQAPARRVSHIGAGQRAVALEKAVTDLVGLCGGGRLCSGVRDDGRSRHHV